MDNSLHYIIGWVILFLFSFLIFWPINEMEEAVFKQKGISTSVVIILRMVIVATCVLGIIHILVRDYM